MRLRSERLTWREIEGEIVALDLESSTYFTINPTGATIVKRLAEGATRSELVAAVVDEFDVAEPRAAGDVDSFLQSLEAHGLLDDAG